MATFNILICIACVIICTSASSLQSIQCSAISESQCIIDCNHPSSCRNNLFNASKIDNKLNIELQCNGDYSCHFFSFHGSSSKNISITIFCNGKRSCLSSMFYLSNVDTQIYSSADDSMIDTEIIHAIDSPVSIPPNLQINFLESCSSLISIICFDEISKCFISCGNKNIEILSNWFTFIIESSECIQQQFTSSCYGKQEVSKEIQCKNNQITNNNNNFHSVILWNIQSSNNHNCSLSSTKSTYSEILKCNDYSECNIVCSSLSNNYSIYNQCDKNTKVIDGHYTHSLSIDCFNNLCTDLDVICPNHSLCIIYCHQHAFCDDLDIYINDNYTDLYVECNTQSTCSHITIYGDQSSTITVHCTNATCDSFLIFGEYSSHLVLYSISNSIIDAEYAHSVTLHCGDNNAKCWNTDLFVENTLYFTLIANGNMAAKNISIYADYVQNVNLSSEKHYGITDSSVSVTHSDNFQMSCFGGYGEITCYNIDLYLPLYTYSLLCQGIGCQQLHLHWYSKNISYTNFKMNGCGVCDSIKDCIDEWTIYCGWNESDIFDGIYVSDTCYDNHFVKYINNIFMIDTKQCKYAITNAPTNDPTSNPIKYFPVETDILSNNLIRKISFILAIITISVSGLIILISIYYLGKHLFLTIKTKYLSIYYLYKKRPYMFFLWCCIFAELFIFTSMYYCSIKLILFYHYGFNYCNQTYPTENHGKICNEDALCFNKWKLFLQYENNECRLDLEKYFFLSIWQFAFGILFLIEFARIITVRRSICSNHSSYYPLINIGYPEYCDLFNSHCICFMVFCPPSPVKIRDYHHDYMFDNYDYNVKTEISYENWKTVFLKRLYWKRYFWFGARHTCNFIFYVLEHIFRYGICIGVSLWFYIIYYDIDSINNFHLYADQQNDFALKWYDFIPFIILLVIKILLQISYVIGPKYTEFDRKQDEAWFIEQTLVDIFGIDVGKIIQSYLPFFYNDSQCPKKLLLGKIANISEYDMDYGYNKHSIFDSLDYIDPYQDMLINTRQRPTVVNLAPRHIHVHANPLANNTRIELQQIPHHNPLRITHPGFEYGNDVTTTGTETMSDTEQSYFDINHESKIFINNATTSTHHHFIDDRNQPGQYYPSAQNTYYYHKPKEFNLNTRRTSKDELERRRIELFKSSLYQYNSDFEAEEKAQQPLQKSYYDNEESDTEGALDKEDSYKSSTPKLQDTL
eukprot:42923_1